MPRQNATGIPIGHQAIVFNSAAQTVSTGAISVLAFNTELLDGNNFANLGSSPERVTINAGVFLVGMSVTWDSNTAGTQRYAAIRHHSSDGTVLAVYTDRRAPIFETPNQVTRLISSAFGDYLQLTAFQDSGTSRTVNAGIAGCALWLIRQN